jgi:tetratricopeptide (TPR) repeat protein
MVKVGLLAGGDELRRFQNEAEAVALLDHPGVVPVYEVGEHQGQHYFSMKLVGGGSLAPLIDRYTADPRAAAGLLAEAAEAVAHAHARGILHRDLKPANILVDDRGRPHVTDFGLAKRVEGDIELTQSGAIMGTPAYMSPEQATGRRGGITVATDVYGLGAVLYALLAGQAPFGGDSVVETLDAVRHRPPEPPTRLNARVPRDLETICLKCLEKDPRRRYATAQAMADDLRAWLESRPIAARRVGAAERVWLWCRRKPAMATMAAAVVLALVGGAAATIAVQANANRALRDKNVELTAAYAREADANAGLAAANTRVEQRYGLAVDAIKTFHTGVSEDFLLKQESFKELRDRLLRSAADFYGRLGALLGREDDPDSRRALSRANFELAGLTAMVGRTADALAAHRSVLSARRAMAAKPGAGPASTAEVGRSLTEVARLLESSGKNDEAMAAYREAEALLTGPASGSPEVRSAVADSRSRMGWLLSRIGRSEEALAAYRLARADQEPTATAAGATKPARRELADTINRIGALLWQTGRPSEAEAEYRQALAIQQGLAAEDPAATEFRSRVATSHNNLGSLLSQTDRPLEAEAEYRKAMAIWRDQAEANPAVADFRSRLALGHYNLGLVLGRMGRVAEAEDENRRAVAIYRRLAEENPAVTDYRSRLALIQTSFGAHLERTGRKSEAEAEFRQALAIQRRLAEENPAVTDFRFRLATSHNSLGNLLGGTGRPLEAEAEHRAALAIRRGLAEAEPGNADRRRDVGISLNNLADLDLDAGRLDAAVARFRESVAMHERLAVDQPTITEYRSGLALALTGLGRALLRDGRSVEAAGPLRRAAALQEAIGDREVEGRFDLACSLALLAMATAPAGAEAEAEAASGRAMDALRRAIASGYRADPARIRADRDWTALRGRADFGLLLMDLAMPDEAFAGRD